jgi:shikimate 5-dehydrogenase
MYGLRTRGASVTVFARNLDKARLAAQAFDVQVAPLESLVSSDVSVIINTSPVGMHGHSEDQSSVSHDAFAGRKIAYDLVYNPIETRFLKLARQAGCHCIGGLDMLIAQAAVQFKLWTGEEPSIEVMRQAALSALAAR